MSNQELLDPKKTPSDVVTEDWIKEYGAGLRERLTKGLAEIKPFQQENFPPSSESTLSVSSESVHLRMNVPVSPLGEEPSIIKTNTLSEISLDEAAIDVQQPTGRRRKGEKVVKPKKVAKKISETAPDHTPSVSDAEKKNVSMKKEETDTIPDGKDISHPVPSAPREAVISPVEISGKEEPVETETAVSAVDAVQKESAVDLEAVRRAHEERLRLLQEEEGNIETDGSKIETVTPLEESLQTSIDGLRTLVGEMRAHWVETDVRNTTSWKKFKSLFGIEQDTKKDDAQIEYEKALKNLQDAEMKMIRSGVAEDGMILSPQDMQEGTERLLRYYKLDESINLINERTQYKADHQNLSEKIIDSIGALGRAYNHVPLKQKLLIAGAFAGIALATTVSGGSGTALGAMAFVSMTRKIASGAGTAVGVEALLESFGARNRTSEAEKEIAEQMAALEKGSSSIESEASFDSLSIFLESDIASLNTKLQNEKRMKTWRKLGAVGVGGLVGSGWLTQFAMEKLGVGEAIHSVKEHLFGVSSETHLNIPVEEGQTPKGMFPSELTDAQKSVDIRAATEYMTASPEDQELIRGATGLTDAELRALAPQSSTLVPAESAGASSGVIDTFVNRDIIVERGDSVWKIAGGLADKLGLEGTSRTHFIDALKDQYGDVQLKTGETINFSAHGIDKGFIESALVETKALSPEQLASIASNDVRVAEYVAGHSDVTLTHAKVDEILSGKIAPQPVGENMNGGSGEYTPPLEHITDSSVSSTVPAELPAVPSEPVFTAELTPRVNDWYMQIFQVENPGLGQDWIVDKKEMSTIKLMDIFRDAKLYKAGSFTGYKTGLSPEQIKNFTQFFQGVEDNKIVFDRMAFLREHPNVTVMDYLKKIATLVPPGQRLGLYTTTR